MAFSFALLKTFPNRVNPFHLVGLAELSTLFALLRRCTLCWLTGVLPVSRCGFINGGYGLSSLWWTGARGIQLPPPSHDDPRDGPLTPVNAYRAQLLLSVSFRAVASVISRCYPCGVLSCCHLCSVIRALSCCYSHPFMLSVVSFDAVIRAFSCCRWCPLMLLSCPCKLSPV